MRLRRMILVGFVVLGAGPAYSQSQFRRGDASSDQFIDISDAVLTLEFLFLDRGDLACEDAADSNDDGFIDLSDALNTLFFLFLGEDPMPAPGLSCGVDPTADNLSCPIYPRCMVLSGIAVAGAPIIGQVIVKDAAGKLRTAAIDVGGSYTVSVAGMTPPFMVRAEGEAGGRTYAVHSAATVADIGGIINITPLTDLIVANVARQVAENYFNSGNFRNLTAADPDTAETALQASLQEVLTALGLGPSIDLLRAAFSVNHQGVDAVLDVIRVSVDAATNTALITNVINEASIAYDLAISSNNSILDSTGTASGMSDWEAVLARLKSFEAFFAAGLPSAKDPKLRNQFDQTGFLQYGANLATFLGEVTSDPSLIGLAFAPPSLVSYRMATPLQDGRAVVSLKLRNPPRGRENFEWVFTGFLDTVTGGTNWVIAGNQYIADIDIQARSTLGFYGPDPQHIQSGLYFSIEDIPDNDIDYAVLTGPGLQGGGGADGNSAGALFVRPPASSSYLAIGPYVGPGTPGHPRGTNYWAMYAWTDAEIAALPSDNLEYTARLFDDRGTPADLTDDRELAAYSFNILKPPLPAGSLSPASFPVITGPPLSEVTNAGKSGGSLTFEWTLPPGTMMTRFNLTLFYSDTNNVIAFDPEPNDTSATVQISPPATGLTGGVITTRAADICCNRHYSYRLWLP